MMTMMMQMEIAFNLILIFSFPMQLSSPILTFLLFFSFPLKDTFTQLTLLDFLLQGNFVFYEYTLKTEFIISTRIFHLTHCQDVNKYA